MKRNFLKIRQLLQLGLQFSIAATLFIFQGCNWFESPKGEVEIVSVYSAEDELYRYCFAEVKITNTGNCDIYTSNLSAKACSNKNTYYKSASLSTVIAPGKTLYITIDFSIPLTKEEKETVSTTSTTSTGTTNTSGSQTSSTSSSTTNSTSTTKTTNANNVTNKEIWKTETVKIIDVFFD